jgi:Low affinity iron permease
MLLTHLGKTPQIARDAYIASNAMNCRIIFGAQVIAEGGSMEIGRECIVMENAVLRAGDRHPLTIDTLTKISLVLHELSPGFSGLRHASARTTSTCQGAAIIVGWALTGPMFHYSDSWQLVINTSTTIITI